MNNKKYEQAFTDTLTIREYFPRGTCERLIQRETTAHTAAATVSYTSNNSLTITFLKCPDEACVTKLLKDIRSAIDAYFDITANEPHDATAVTLSFRVPVTTGGKRR